MPNQPNQPNINASPQSANSQVPAETQALMDMFVINGMELIYDEKQAQTMLPRISSGEDPTKAMADQLVDIVNRIVSSAKESGKIIPPEVILHGSNILFAEMLKVLEAAGMPALNEEQKTGVWQMFSSLYIDQALKSGQMTQEELMSLSKQIEATDEGKQIMKTAENPAEAIKGLRPANSEQATEQPAQPAMTAPQGGM